MYAIVDANNFYASCERLFQPQLSNTPIVVLSNNDGCVIARSNEAKALGVAMGVPYFEIKQFAKRYKVRVFSSNYAFYGDMSNRIMSILESQWPEVAVYSIDEAFLDLSLLPESKHGEFCWQLQKKVRQCTGIPVSIGIGPTKTLAKLANHVAKKCLKQPVFNITNEMGWLKSIDVADVWGVGRKWSKKLISLGVKSAYDLSEVDHVIFRRKFSVVLERTIMELRGIDCIELDIGASKKQIISSKSFGKMQTSYTPIAQALSNYVARATEKLRKQGSLASTLSVFLRTNPFREDLPYCSKSIGLQLVNPSDDVRVLTSAAKRCLKQIYQEGFHYKKTGVMLSGLVNKSQQQLMLFDNVSDDDQLQNERLMGVLSDINQKFGRYSIHMAAEGVGKKSSWQMRSSHRTQRYTTCWDELPVVYAH